MSSDDAELRQEIPLPCGDLVDLLTRYTPVQDNVSRHLSIGDIVALSRTAKGLSGCVGLVERTQFDINKRLERFFKNPKAFRTLQARHNIVITGSFVLGFMSRKWLSRELEEGDVRALESLLVQKGPEAVALRSFLMNEGYQLSSTNSFPDRPIMVRTNGQYVGIRELNRAPFSWINHPGLTCDVNFITWNKAYSVFAHQTFISKDGYLLQHIIHTPASDILNIWNNIGIGIAPISLQDALSSQSNTDPSSTHPKSSMLRKRLIGDKHSWIVPLNTSGIEPPPFPNSSFDYAGFEITTSMQNASNPPAPSQPLPFGHYVVNMTFLKSHALRHQYAFADKARAEHQRFRDYAVVQLYNLPRWQRPTGFAQIFAQRDSVDLSGIGAFAPPGGWIYYDDEMLKMLEMRNPGAVRRVER